MEIESYSFGRVTVGGTSYTKDLIILPDRVLPGWRRLSGHVLDLADLEEVMAFKPDILIVGTGAFGRMEVPESIVGGLVQRGIRAVTDRTKKACLFYNEHLRRRENVAAAFHLTC